MKRPITYENIVKIEPYRSILLLLDRYPRLEQKHLRYVLCKDEDKTRIYSTSKIQEYLGPDIKIFIEGREIKTESITTRYNLNKFLNNLIRLGAVKYYKKGKRGFYSIRKPVKTELLRIENIESINLYPSEDIIEVRGKSNRKHILYGFPEKRYSEFGLEGTAIKESVMEIENALDRIKNARDTLIEKSWDSFLEKQTKKISGQLYEVFFKPKSSVLLDLLIDIHNYSVNAKGLKDFFEIELTQEQIDIFNNDPFTVFDEILRKIIKMKCKDVKGEDIDGYLNRLHEEIEKHIYYWEIDITFSSLGSHQ